MNHDRRAKVQNDLSETMPWPLRITRAGGWLLVIGIVMFTGLADFATGETIWFGPIYLLAVGVAAWSLGWREAVGVSTFCIGLSLLLNGFALYPFGTGAVGWNLAIRAVLVVSVVALLHNLRRCYSTEWILARTDPLTGAFNRKAFFETLGAGEARGWDVVAYADLDGLKNLNDEFGHAAGDAVIAAFAQKLKNAIRKSDILVRMGGDEFLVYMRVRDEEAGKMIAKRIHGVINDNHSVSALRCSLGVLLCSPGIRAIDREIRLADELMYEAKNLGGSLAVATASHSEGEWKVVRHWELTPLLAVDRHSAVGGEPREFPRKRVAAVRNARSRAA